MLGTNAGRPDVCIDFLIQSRLRRCNVVLRLQPSKLTHNLGVAQLHRAIERKSVAVDFVFDGSDVAAQTTRAVLEPGTNCDIVRQSDITAEHTIAEISLKIAVIIKFVGFVTFTGNIGPHIDTGMERLINCCAVRDSFRHSEVRTTSHSLNTC